MRSRTRAVYWIAAGRTAERAGDALGPGLQDARRDVTRALEVMRHAARERGRGPERDRAARPRQALAHALDVCKT